MLYGAKQDPGTMPETGGWDNSPTVVYTDPPPKDMPPKTIVLTLDDVPQSGVTQTDLTTLAVANLHSDFFANVNNLCGDLSGAAANPECVGDIMNVLSKHSLGNHSVQHWHLGVLDGSYTDGYPHCTNAACVESQITGVEAYISRLTNGATPHLTRFRAPFGEPYYAAVASDLATVGPVVAKYAVEVDWNFDSDDSLHPWPSGGQSLYDHVINDKLKKGAFGIVLMHGTLTWTRDMLPMLLTYLKNNGYQFATVEDVICWKFGMHSWEIVNKTNNYTGTPQERKPN
jgi:peptidoglycan/xylan/chitin deacetylase (PgdA/CDA1 family)